MFRPNAISYDESFIDTGVSPVLEECTIASAAQIESVTTTMKTRPSRPLSTSKKLAVDRTTGEKCELYTYNEARQADVCMYIRVMFNFRISFLVQIQVYGRKTFLQARLHDGNFF